MIKQLKAIQHIFADFFHRHLLLMFVILPLIILTAKTVGFLTAIWVIIFMPFFWLKDRRTAAILLTHIIFIIGDNRAVWADNVRPVRNIAMSLLFILTVWDIIQGKYKLNLSFLLWLPFIAWCIFGITRSPIPLDCGLRTLSYFFMIFISLHSIVYEFKRTKGRFVTDWISFMNVAFLIGLLLLILKPDWVILALEFVEEADGARYQGVYGNPNGIGMACTVLFPMLMLERFYLRHFPKAYSNLSFLILIITMLLSGSRSTLLSTILFSIFFYIENRNLFIRNALKYLVIPGSGLFLSLFGMKIILAIPVLAKRLRISEGMSFEDVTSGRGQVWNFLFTVGRFSKIEEWIWLGKGFYYDSYFFFKLFTTYHLPHQFAGVFSGIMALIMNHGLIGIVIFFITHIICYRRIKLNAFILPLFILMFFSSIFESWIVSSLNAFSLMFYAIVAIGQTDMSDFQRANKK